MNISDPVSDLLARLRNALSARHEKADIPSSRFKVELARILKDEGYITEYVVTAGGVQPTLEITLKYGNRKERVITGIRRISKPGLRVYAKKDEMPRVLGGLGIAVISTSKGVMTDKQAKKAGVGGEVIAYVW